MGTGGSRRSSRVAAADISVGHFITAAPVTVMAACLDQRRLAQWWGPDGYTNPVCQVEPWTGGAVRLHMRAPTGTFQAWKGRLVDVDLDGWLLVSIARIGADGRPSLDLLMSMRVWPSGPGSLVSLDADIATPGIAATATRQLDRGLQQSVRRLASYLTRGESLPKASDIGYVPIAH